MSERFWEAHDLIIKAWTSHDGPFNWEGRYFHHRQVNIWPRPYQGPHPPVWITSLSPGSVPPIADRRYVVGTFLTGFDGSKAIFDAYRGRARETGWEAPNDRFAYAALVYTGETDEEGFAGARKLMWYIESNRVAPQFINPPGYIPAETAARMLRNGGSLYKYNKPDLEGLIAQGIVFAGNPNTVFKQIKTLYDHNGGFGHLLVMGQAGFLDNRETLRGIDLLAKEVYPRLRELN
jgi:alkanesulfonate monooxygenase SsuD/methylene tetrahydromethanopterin reductase-like flavin-dependent oxidoreductase (luciferase family)